MPETAEQRHEIAFILRLASLLHTHGYPAHSLEAVLAAAARRLGIEAQFFSTPTSLFIAFGPQDEQRTHLIRVEPGSTNLGMISGLDAIASEVALGTLGARDGLSRMEALVVQPSHAGPALRTLAFVAVAVGLAALLDGGALDLAVAGMCGLVTGLLTLAAERWRALGPVLEPMAAFFASLVALSAATMTGSTHDYLTTLSGLIILLPGLMLTLGLTELSSQHLQSGTSRLSGAMVVFFGMAFGIALGYRAAAWLALPGILPIHNPPLPDWVAWIAPVVAPACFVVLLRGARRDAPAIVLAGVGAWFASRAGALMLGEQLGGFVGALTVAAGSNWYARRARRSSLVTTIPGLLMLVPGSIGFRSITSLLGDDALAGVETAFRVALVGISLAAGLLLGNAVVPPAHMPDPDPAR
ncbi:MAG: threonine/serine exporter family protein [Gemmatimonadetes bacterium]|nr:threonine/serine exporter family protein [Gemmatimonadota bacterium]